MFSLSLRFRAYDESCGGHVGDVWPKLIGECYPALSSLNLVDQVMSFVHRILQNWANADQLSEAGTPLLDFIEFCAGRGMLTRGMIHHGYRCAAFDKIYSSAHDMLSASGLRLFLDALTSTRKRGMNWWGTKCSSFVSLCASVSQRNAFNAWLGDQTRFFVVEGNLCPRTTHQQRDATHTFAAKRAGFFRLQPATGLDGGLFRSISKTTAVVAPTLLGSISPWKTQANWS